MRDRLFELLNYIPCKAECCSALDGGRCGDLDKLDRCQIEAIADYLLVNGVVVPPVSVEQTVYRVYWNYNIDTCRVSALTQKSDKSWKIRVTSGISKCVFEITPDKLGKTVFLTREEAEAKLQEGKG